MDSSKELIIITGVSGAGKSSAMAFMEDAGYYCIDNMPPELMSTFVSLLANNSEYYPKVAMVVDIRSGYVFEKIIASIDSVEQYGYTCKIVYLDINDTEALKRYKLTRRKHPFADKFNGNIQNALDYEREILAPLRLKADHIIDTSNIDTHQLRARLTELLMGDAKEYMNIHCMSFGFKYGVSTESDLVFDVRCLPNPYYIPELRHHTGCDACVRDYVMQFEQSKTLLQKIEDLLDFLIPLYIKEGKSRLVIAFGCTGGKHRSITFTELIGDYLIEKGMHVIKQHRDIGKDRP